MTKIEQRLTDLAFEVQRLQNVATHADVERKALTNTIAALYGTVIAGQIAILCFFNMNGTGMAYGALALGVAAAVATSVMAKAGVEKTQIAAHLARLTTIAIGTPVFLFGTTATIVNSLDIGIT